MFKARFELLHLFVKGINQKSKEVYLQNNPDKDVSNAEQFGKLDILAFIGTWYYMDCVPYRNRLEYWNANRFR